MGLHSFAVAEAAPWDSRTDGSCAPRSGRPPGVVLAARIAAARSPAESAPPVNRLAHYPGQFEGFS